MKLGTCFATVLLSLTVGVPAAYVAPANADLSIPRPIKRNANYFFYMHGLWIEQNGLNGVNRRYGTTYQYNAIVRALRARGFTVISEPRLQFVRIPQYARQVARRVKTLLRAGVLPRRITVGGHSKGGVMSVVVSVMVANPRVNFVIMAGCGQPSGAFARAGQRLRQRAGPRSRGRILSIYDRADRHAGSCNEVFARSRGVRYREIVLRTGKGHGLFYRPDGVWLDPVAGFARGR